MHWFNIFKVQAATWALDRGVTVVICNGMQEKAIKTILAGRKIGTFFTESSSGSTSVEVLAENGKKCHLGPDIRNLPIFMARIKLTRRAQQEYIIKLRSFSLLKIEKLTNLFIFF